MRHWLRAVSISSLSLWIVGVSAMPKMPPAVVETAQAAEQSWRSDVSATGVLSAAQGVMIRSEISGRITKVAISSGQAVVQDQLLFQLNPNVLEARVAEQTAQLPLNQQNFERQQTLFKKGVASAAEVDKARAVLRSNQAALAAAKAMLAQTQIRAPFAGQLGIKQVSVGDFIQPGQDLISLQNLSKTYIDFKVAAKSVPQLAVGETVLFTLDAAGKTTYEGRIIALESEIDARTRSLNVRAQANQTSANLVPGTFVNVNILVGKKRPVVTVPSTAIVYDAAGDFVYKLVDGKAKKTLVKLGQQRQDTVAILSGIKVGDVVISAGQVKLFDGAPVMDAKAMRQGQPGQSPAHSKP